MKAVRLIAPGRPLEMQEVEIPRVGPRGVLVRVKAAGICHKGHLSGQARSVVCMIDVARREVGRRVFLDSKPFEDSPQKDGFPER